MEKWTTEEIEILRNNYATLSSEDLLVLFENRTYGAIKHKASRLKLICYKQTSEQRFWKKVEKGQNHECWLWIGLCNNKGYGQININGKHILTHRFSREIYFGKISQELCVLHKCNNPPCVNPNHLYLGTNKDNSEYMVKQNRQAKGENHGRSKLTESQVKEIRRLCREGNFLQREIAKMFNVGPITIWYIYTNKIWKHI